MRLEQKRQCPTFASMSTKDRLHPRNRHRGPYNFESLTAFVPELAHHLLPSPRGGQTLDFSQPAAVKLLNRALLAHGYGVKDWNFPDDNLCPAVPGRADAIHKIADLMRNENFGNIPRGDSILGLDIGTGASCIYPILGAVEYGWSFMATDIAEDSLAAAGQILSANPQLQGAIRLLAQPKPQSIFHGIFPADEPVDFTLCNPPFHASSEEALAGAQRKRRNLGSTDATLNFSGVSKELICPGGELGFIRNMIRESRDFGQRVFWFTSLVAKQKHLPPLQQSLRRIGAADVQILPMGTGNKSSRLLAWTFLDANQRKLWRDGRWAPAKQMPSTALESK